MVIGLSYMPPPYTRVTGIPYCSNLFSPVSLFPDTQARLKGSDRKRLNKIKDLCLSQRLLISWCAKNSLITGWCIHAEHSDSHSTSSQASQMPHPLTQLICTPTAFPPIVGCYWSASPKAKVRHRNATEISFFLIRNALDIFPIFDSIKKMDYQLHNEQNLGAVVYWSLPHNASRIFS